MSNPERQSPRTAIRTWLVGTDRKSTAKPDKVFPEQKDIERRSGRHARPHHRISHPSKHKGQPGDINGRKRQRDDGNKIQPKGISGKAIFVDSPRTQLQKTLKESTAIDSNGSGLVERLGLHAPFRSLEDHRLHDISDVQGRPRKRRYSRTSTSSYLEPAAANDISDVGDDLGHTTIQHTAHSGPAFGSSGRHNSPTACQGSDMLPSPEKLLTSYERRPRRKTREDHYELKTSNRDSDKTRNAAKKDREVKKQKKHKRKEKSGAALMHGFNAENVARDRLTMKPAMTLGLFGKGRASSPVRRRGLPDLAFSEMAFLASRRERPKDTLKDSTARPSDKNKRRLSTKAADTEAEISRYFMSVEPTILKPTTSLDRKYRRDKRRSRDHESPQALVDLPDTPFLGFGSCGPNTSISPAKRSVSHRKDSQYLTRSTGSVTWSQSEAPSYVSPPPARRHRNKRSKMSISSNQKCKSSAPHKRQHSVPCVSPPVQPISAETKYAASRSHSRHENAMEPLDQKQMSRLATEEWLRSTENSRDQAGTGNVEVDIASVPPQVEGSVPEETHPAEADKLGDPKPAIPPEDQATSQSSRREPRPEPQPHDVHSLPTRQPNLSPHKDSLDDVLDALLKECDSKVAGSIPASRALSSHHDLCVNEEAVVPEKIQELPRMPTCAVIGGFPPLEAPASASNLSAKPRSIIPEHASRHDNLVSTHALSQEDLNSSHRTNSGYTWCAQSHPSIPAQEQGDSSNAWNGYDTLYGRQQKEAQSTQVTPIGSLLSYTAARDNFLNPWRYGVEPEEYAQDLNTVQVGDKLDGYRLRNHESLGESNGIIEYQEVGRDEWDDRVGENSVSNYQQVEINAENEQSFARLTNQPNQHMIEDHLFERNAPGIYPSWRPHHTVNEADAALSDFWTPHKLY